MQYTNNLMNFFGNAANTIKAKIAQLNPINRFIKFSLEQLFQQLIKDQTISYENLISGIIQLPNLQLDTQKINKKYFFATPFVLHSGKIGHLQIKLPSFTQMDKQNIEVQIKKIHLTFQHIQNFQENFKKIMEEIKDFLYHFVQEKTSDYCVVQKGSQDYFKETLKQLLCNMKVRIEDVAVCVHLQNPQNEPKKDSFSILLKVPLINVHRGIDSIKKEKQGVEQMNFDCQIPQFSIHLMDSNLAEHEGFPFCYPLHTHSSTVLMFGISKFKDLKIQTDERIPRFNISILKNIEKSEKKVKLSFNFPQLELMTDPSQIMIIILFAKQINAFNHRLIALKKQLKIDEQNPVQQQPADQAMKRSKSHLYSSVSISLLQSGVFNVLNLIPNMTKLNQPPNVVDSIIQKNRQSNGDLFMSINEFNSFVGQSIAPNAQKKPVVEQVHNSVMGQSIAPNAQKKPVAEQVQYISFKEFLQVKVSVKSVLLCFQKYNMQQKTQKMWNFQKESKYPKLQNSYFLLSIQGTNFHLKDDKSIQMSISDFKLEHVKYLKEKQLNAKKFVSMMNSQGGEEQFSDLKNSQKFYSESEMSMIQTQKIKTQHYCIDQILYISNSSTEKIHNQEIKKHNVTSSLKTKHQDQLYQKAFQFHSSPPNSNVNQHKQHVNCIAITAIMLKFNTQLVKQIMDLYLMVEKQVFTLLEENQANKDKTIEEKLNLPEVSQEDLKKVTIVTIRQLIIGHLDKDLKDFTSCVQKYQNHISQEFQTCFCNTKTQGVYLKVEQIDLRVNIDTKKLSFSSFGLGFMRIDDSQISSVTFLLKILETTHEKQLKKRFRLSYQNGKQGVPAKIGIVSPQVVIEINQSETLDCINLVHKQLQCLKLQLTRLLKTKENVKPKQSKGIKSQESQIPVKSIEPIVKLFIEKLKVKFLNIEAQVHNICVSQQPGFFSLKFSALVIALRDSIEFYTSMMKNQRLILTPCDKKGKYSNIPSTNIAVQLNAAPSLQFKFVHEKMSQFLDKISKAEATFELVVKGSEIPQNGMTSQNSTKIILTVPIYINAIMLLRIIQSKYKIHEFFREINTQMQKMKQQMKEILPSKEDKKIKSQKVSLSKQITISKGALNIDIRPTYRESSNNYDKNSKFKEQPKCVMLSNSRSFVQISWGQCKIEHQQKRVYFQGTLQMSLHFKYSQDHLQDKIQNIGGDFKTKGFIELLKINRIHNKIQIIDKKIRISVQVNSLQFQSNIETLPWISLHFKHFLLHNVQRNLGFTQQEYEDRTEQLKADDYDLGRQKATEIINLDDGAKIYTQKQIRKKLLENQFLSERFVKPPLDQKCQFYIETITLASVSLKIVNKVNSQSSIDLTAKNIQIHGKIPQFSNFSLKLFGSISELKIVHQNIQQKKGFFSFVPNYIYSNSYGKFTVLQNSGQIKFLLDKDHQRTYIKFDKCTFDVGFRSVILELVDVYNKLKQALKKSGWKKEYDEKRPTKIIEQTGNTPLILVAIPENTISVSLIYEWYSILDKRSVDAPKFILHEESDKIKKIDEFVIDWVKTLLSNNVAGLVTGALMESFNLVISQIVNLVRFLLSCIF